MQNRRIKKNGKSPFKKLIGWLHLWLGLVSGIVVFIVSITGCIYVFQQDIKDAQESWRFVEAEQQSMVPPGTLLDSANAYVQGLAPTGLTYAGKTGAAAVGYERIENGRESFEVVFMNPYSGKFIKKQSTSDANFDFFRFIIDGHRYLWLPQAIGKKIVDYATLIFIFLLISGLILWWPKNLKKAEKRKAFFIKWNAKFKRLVYDLHNVVGFYSLILAFIIVATGVVVGLTWFKDGVYFVASGGETQEMQFPPSSPSSETAQLTTHEKLNKAWYKVMNQEQEVPKGMYISPNLSNKNAPILIISYHDSETFYDRSTYYFDQYSLQRIHTPRDSYKEASFANKLMMLNYDIHIGAVGGTLGKILAFIISLICASLPVTGFLYWWNRPKKKRIQQPKQKKKEKVALYDF